LAIQQQQQKSSCFVARNDPSVGCEGRSSKKKIHGGRESKPGHREREREKIRGRRVSKTWRERERERERVQKRERERERVRDIYI